MKLSGFARVSRELAMQLRLFGTATVYEAAGRRGRVDSAIRPIVDGTVLAGPAFTVRCPPADNLMIHLAVALAQPGDVLVVDAGGYTQAGMWGEILTVAAQSRELAGIVIDGAVRDVRRIRELGFPVFARAICVGAASKLAPGQVAGPVCCGGVVVQPGDLVLGDDDGVVIVSRAEAEAVLQESLAREKREREVIQALRNGATTLDLLGLRQVLQQLGLEEAV